MTLPLGDLKLPARKINSYTTRIQVFDDQLQPAAGVMVTLSAKNRMRPDWLLLTGLNSGRARLRGGDDSQARVAGVMQVKNYSDSCSVFESLTELSDFTIVLDDNSTTPFPYRDRCDEYLTLANGGPWNAVANRMLLMQRAFVHGCRWLVEMDDDIVFSNGFQTKADVLALIEEAERRKADVCLFRLRDLWESKHEFRTDGIWARKTFNVLVRNWLYYRSISLRERPVGCTVRSFPPTCARGV